MDNNGFPDNSHELVNLLLGGLAMGNEFLGNHAILANLFQVGHAVEDDLPANYHAFANVFHDGDQLADLMLENDNNELRVMEDPCAVCQYENRDCLQNCIFRSAFTGSREGMEDYARCVAVYGENLRNRILALQLPHQQATMEMLKIRALRTFERRRCQAYDEILINLRKRYPWGWLIDPQQLPGVEFLPCMVCVSKRRNMCPQNCIFAPFFPHGRQAENDFNNCLEKYGQDAADFLSGDHTDGTRQQQRIMLLTRCARPLGGGSSYANDESFVADLLNKYIDRGDQERDGKTDGGSLFTNVNFWLLFLISFTVICGVFVKTR